MPCSGANPACQKSRELLAAAALPQHPNSSGDASHKFMNQVTVRQSTLTQTKAETPRRGWQDMRAPDDGVNDQLELRRRHGEQCCEAVLGDGMQQVEELQPVLRVVLHHSAVIC